MIPVKPGADEHYRYKMPLMQIRFVSSGKGQKTAILNSAAIAKHLERAVGCLVQWFTYALCVSAKFLSMSGQLVLSGRHQPCDLLASLYDFIGMFVLCPVCHSPETHMEGDRHVLKLRCRTCGNRSHAPVAKTAPGGRMADWIISNIRMEETATPRRSPVHSNDCPGGSLDVDELRRIELELQTKEPEVGDDERAAFFGKLKGDLTGDMTDFTIFRDVANFAEKIGANDQTRLKMALDALFQDHPQRILHSIQRHRALLILLTESEALQRLLLGLMAQFITCDHPEMLSSGPVIWYTLFDNEIVSEKAVERWFQRRTKPEKDDPAGADKLRETLAGFRAWMNEAKLEGTECEEESDRTPCSVQSSDPEEE
jgi:translation initiation factor 2 beta subunit (eIF-2beta)/eIF-5